MAGIDTWWLTKGGTGYCAEAYALGGSGHCTEAYSLGGLASVVTPGSQHRRYSILPSKQRLGKSPQVSLGYSPRVSIEHMALSHHRDDAPDYSDAYDYSDANATL